jgi:hypothetical protein
MKTIVYVDGFNLCYGSLKGTPYKWLNIRQMSQLLLPNDQIVGIKYFTAKVFSHRNVPQKHIRQQVYWRVLRTLPNLEIIQGHYSEHPKMMRVAHPQKGQPKYVEVIKTEEKGSDVNLAVHLLHDGYQGRYELGVVVSNDSDLLSSIQIVQKDLGLAVGILNPQEHPSNVLKNEASFIKQIRQGVIRASQFPTTMTDGKGSFHKPGAW